MAKQPKTTEEVIEESVNSLDKQIQELTMQKQQLEVAFYKCIGALEILESLKLEGAK